MNIKRNFESLKDAVIFFLKGTTKKSRKYKIYCPNKYSV